MLELIDGYLKLFLLIFPNFIMALTFSGFFTALAAHIQGDTTPKHEGYLTLNPMKHVDVGGSALFVGIMLLANVLLGNSPLTSIVFIMLIMGNIRRQVVVPINEENFTNPIKGQVITLLADPVGSIFYSFLAMTLMRFLPFDTSLLLSTTHWQGFAWQFLDNAATIGIYLGVLDLIPLPPQASGRIIQLLIPEDQEEINEWYSSYGIIVLLGLLLIPGVSDIFFKALVAMAFGIKIIFHKILFGLLA